MGKKIKTKKLQSSFAKVSDDKLRKNLKTECCEKYLKKGAHKRCNRCPCFDMNQTERLQRFMDFEIGSDSQD